MPTVGALADLAGSRMRLFKSFAYGGAIFASTFYFATSGDVVLTLLIYFLAQFGFVGSLVFYDGLLRDITTEDTIDQVSTKGYALGYIGGGLQLVLALVIVVYGTGGILPFDPPSWLNEILAQRIGIATAGIWWAGFSYFSIKRINVTEATQEIPEEKSY